MGARPIKKPPSNLSSVIQGENESLCSRFTEAKMHIEGCTDDQAMQVMENRLWDEDFVKTITKFLLRHFWPILDEDVKKFVRRFDQCQPCSQWRS